MADLRVNFCGVELKNPITTASGTFGFGHEYGEFFDLSQLGGIGVKGLTPIFLHLLRNFSKYEEKKYVLQHILIQANRPV